MQKLFYLIRLLVIPVILGCLPLSSMAQVTVTGKVVSDEENSALVGATVLVRGTTTGALTDGEGNFTINAPDANAVLVISYLGYTTQEVPLAGRTDVTVAMLSDVTNLSEVIITGYTAQSRRDVTGAVASIDTETLNEVAAPNLANQLQGRVAGVTVQQDNRPGASAVIRIRGYGTINNNNPLYIIDGVPTQNTNDLIQINPANIENIQILKDASAASIYGSRAANGVVIITTKKGKVGTPKVTFSARAGIQQATSELDLLNTQQLGELLYNQQRNDYIVNNGSDAGFVFNHPQYGDNPNDPNFIPDFIFPTAAFEGDPATDPSLYSDQEPFYLITRAAKEGTDWYDEVYETAALQEYNLNVSGGTNTANYFVGFNYFTQDGIVKNTGFDRYSFRVNSNLSPTPWLRFGESAEISYTENTGLFGNNSEGNPIAEMYRTHPMIPVTDINGFPAGTRGGGLGNAEPPTNSLLRARDNISESWRIFGSAYMEMDFLKYFTFKTQIGINASQFYGSFFTPRNIEAAEAIAQNSLSVQHNNFLGWTWYNTLNFNTVIGDAHKINVLLGTEAIDNRFRQVQGSRANFFSDDITYRFLNAGEAAINNSHFGSESSLFALFGRANYSLLDRYLFDFTIRRDGSSRFGTNNRYAVFPAFSVGWRVSEEPFLQSADWLTDFKIRGGWGQMGNQEIANDNAFFTYRTSLTASAYDINGTNSSVVAGFDTQRFGNANGKWETTTTTNIGFDLTLWNSLTVNFDWYEKVTEDMLYVLNLPATQGDASAPFQNVGEMNNTGIDLQVSYQNTVLNGDLSYSITANFSQYNNEVVSLGDNEDEVLLGQDRRQFIYTRSVAGQPLSSFYGLIVDGFTTAEDVGNGVYDAYYDRPGRYKYRDLDGNGVIDEDDRTFIGSPHPDFTYGLNLAVNYKNLDVSIFFQGVQGNDIYNYVSRWIDFNTFQGNRSVRMLNESWTPENANSATLPALSANDNLSYQPSDAFIEDGSYFRLRNVQIGYTFDQLPFLSNLRVYVQGTNLFTLTDYSGLDPEVMQGRGTSTLGFDEGQYPISQQFLLGVNFGF